ELRRRHPRFFYEGFERSPYGPRRDALRLRFRFRLESSDGPDLAFAPEIIIEGAEGKRCQQIPGPLLENLFFHLGLIEAFSYWKAACSPEIVVTPPESAPIRALDAAQLAWWGDLLRKGMGEYFYVNQIDFRSPDLVRLRASRDLNCGTRGPQRSELRIPDGERRSLVLTSGGKDSAVTLETLRAAGQPFDCLLVNPTPAALDVAKQAGCEQPILVRRNLDPRLLELNAAGYLNGHTPFSALLAFLGVTVAALFGRRRVMVSNERSAEEATVAYLGAQINHQYSKTYEFETAFRDYCRKYLAPEIEYFSLLRPLYELQIARRFANYPAYFPLFRSCNRGQKDNAWCGQCPKCLFVWTALYPFLEREQMLGIFGRDLFAPQSATQRLRELLGQDASKPFECVGTREETVAAIHLCVEKYRQQGIPLPPALETVRQTVLAARTDLPALARRILASWSEQHHLPADLAEQLRRNR
ncbi:MAG TPA: hypothetical protein VNN17_02465, partial [Terriglobia bacterium]|nr:hypothetical protein [Terriglobia bacterium]